MTRHEAPATSEPQGCYPKSLVIVGNIAGRAADLVFPQRKANRTERAQVLQERANFLTAWGATKKTMGQAAEEDLFSPPGEYRGISVDLSTNTVVLTEYKQKAREKDNTSFLRIICRLDEGEERPILQLIAQYQAETKPLVQLAIIEKLTKALHHKYSKRDFERVDQIIEYQDRCINVWEDLPRVGTLKAQIRSGEQESAASKRVGKSHDFRRATVFLEDVIGEVHSESDSGLLMQPIPQNTILNVVSKEQEYRTQYTYFKAQLKAARVARNKALIDALGMPFIERYLLHLEGFRNITIDQVVPTEYGEFCGALIRLIADRRNPLDYTHLEAVQMEIQREIDNYPGYLQHQKDNGYPDWEIRNLYIRNENLKQLNAELTQEIPQAQARLSSIDQATLTQPEQILLDSERVQEQRSKECGDDPAYGSYTREWLDRMVKELPAREQVVSAVVE